MINKEPKETKETNFNLNFCEHLQKTIDNYRYKKIVKKGIIYFSDKYDDETHFCHLYNEDIKKDLLELKSEK